MLDDSKSGYNTSESVNTTGGINAPDLSPAGKPQRRALSSISQMRNLISSLKTAARERNTRNARIAAKYNSEKPHRQESLEADGLGWKSNFTTKPLPMLINKVSPRLKKALDAVKYLTNSKLPDEVPGAAEKTEAFRREITTLIRSRPGWSDFLTEISMEDVLYGFAAVAWLDEFGWMPKFFRQDQFYVPTGNKQEAAKTQLTILKDKYLIHELFSMVEDREAAKAAGWKVENTIDAINKAMPDYRRNKSDGWERVYEDLQREANVGLSHENGAMVICVWHLFAQEVDGKVSHYILTDEGAGKDSKELLFEREDQFESMPDALALFAFEYGNGTLHGSKGIGREVYAMAAMLDRARNEVVDRMNLAGKIIIQGDDKALRRFKMSIVGNAILIGQGYQVTERKINPDIESYLQLDQFLTSLLDQMAGAVTPKALEGERVTAAAVNLLASREEESRDTVTGRFLTQFATAQSTIQKRICDPNVSDEDAKAFQKKMLNIMSREELTQIAGMPVAETVADYTTIERQQIVAIAAENKGDPLFNQKELRRRSMSAQIDDEFANSVLLPDEDPTIVSEQTRLQQMEMLLIAGQGTQVPVSPRDNHVVHLGILMPALEQAAQVTAQQPDGLPVLEAILAHAQAHLQGAEQSGVPKDQLAPIAKIINSLAQELPKLKQIADAEQAAQQAQQQVQLEDAAHQAGAADAAAGKPPQI